MSATQVKVIICKDYIYATYCQTICFKAFYLNEEQKHEQIKEAYYSAYAYATGFSSVTLSSIDMTYQYMKEADIFEYLKQCHSENPNFYNYIKPNYFIDWQDSDNPVIKWKI